MIADHVLKTLEFHKVLARLSQFTSFSASRELVDALVPKVDLQWITEAQSRTTAARALLETFPETSIGGVRDLRSEVDLARRGAVLDSQVLANLSSTIRAMRLLRTRVMRNEPEFAPLRLLGERLPMLPLLEQAIDRAVSPDGEVLDSASSELARIRRAVRIAFDRLQDKLQSLITSSQYATALQEPIITVRDGRYVVPVKAAQRRVIRGIVHDQSASGATLYIEPLATVELNNAWRELQLSERQEIQRILLALSDLVAQDGSAIMAGIVATAEIDLAFAKAKYSSALQASQPRINQQAALDDPHPEADFSLFEARHPLIAASDVVPTTLWLGGPTRMIIITGPNTGGKTVALKTLGLLTLMAQAGLHIPAQPGSRLPLVEQVFADIGDEQSIEQSLSTFSSHMTNIIGILDSLTPRSLVLLDELGAGTDPVEGAALARAIIERLLDEGCWSVSTSHYAELKAYAYSTPGVENASVEFNVETLSPTYRLSIGLPGRSNALAIAERLGLQAAIIERARASVSREDEQVEDLLAGIHREQKRAADEAVRTIELREDTERVRDRLSRELYEFEQARELRLADFQEDLDSELREVRTELRRLRDEFRSVSVSRQWMEQAEQRVSDVAERMKEKAKVAKPKLPKPVALPKSAPQQRPLAVGDQVYVSSVKLSGEVLDIDLDGGEAEVQLGGFRLRVDLRELRREKGGSEVAIPAAPRQPAISLPKVANVSMQLDMRGWRAAEVEDQLDHYLNDAYLANLLEVRLVHGKGTGALRQVVRTFLRTHPLVESFASGAAGEGGDGVTVARMVAR